MRATDSGRISNCEGRAGAAAARGGRGAADHVGGQRPVGDVGKGVRHGHGKLRLPLKQVGDPGLARGVVGVVRGVGAPKRDGEDPQHGQPLLVVELEGLQEVVQAERKCHRVARRA